MTTVRQRYRAFIDDGKGEEIAYCDLTEGPGGEWWLTDLWVHPEHRGKGHATRMMAAVLTTFGDKLMCLRVQPFAGSPLRAGELADWYRRFGFEHADAVPWVFIRPANREDDNER